MSLPRAGRQQRDLASPLTLLRGPFLPNPEVNSSGHCHLPPGALSPPSALDAPGSGPGTGRGPAQPYYVIWSRFPCRRRSSPGSRRPAISWSSPPESILHLTEGLPSLSGPPKCALRALSSRFSSRTPSLNLLSHPRPTTALRFIFPTLPQLNLHPSSCFHSIHTSSCSFLGSRSSTPVAHPLKGRPRRPRRACLPDSSYLDLALLSTELPVVQPTLHAGALPESHL